MYEVTGWIAVEKSLPPENGGYLTVQNYQGVKCVDTAHFWRFGKQHPRRGQTEWTIGNGEDIRPVTVTHWMPLPNLP